MEQLPKIAQQRLQATAKAGVHLDANLLSAFFEKSLGKRERAQVLDHLARCADCRDAVSRALPEPESGQAVARRPGSAWLSGPMVRWGALVACVVVVGAAVTLRYRSSSPARSEVGTFMSPARISTDDAAEQRAQETPVPQEPVDKTVVGLGPRPDLQAKEDEALSSKLAERLRQPEELKSRNAVSLSVGALAKNEPAAVPPEPTVATPPAKTAELEQGRDNAQKVEAQDFAYRNEAVIVPSDVAAVPSAEAVSGKAKDADEARKKPQSGRAAGLAAASGSFTKRQLGDTKEFDELYGAGGRLVPRWTLSSDGILQRSLDGGKTWETILVPGKGVFRAVAALGSDIWVGGSAGTLYHSADAGAHWLQVTPAVDGQALTADIIGIEFSDARHGKLTTADRETWITPDGGQSWHKD